MISRRLLGALAGATAFAAAVATPAAAAPTEVNFWFALSGQLGDVVNELVNKFNASQDQYKVNALYKGEYPEVLNASVAAFRNGKPPHFIQVHEAVVQTMMLSRAIVPVQDMMTEQGYKIDWDNYIQPLVNWYKTADGKLLSMPFNTSSPVLYWNKDMFQKAGLDPNKGPKTWAEFEETLKKLKAAGVTGYIEGGEKWVHLENYAFAQAIPSGTKRNGIDGLDTELNYNDPRFVAHLTRAKGWLDAGMGKFTGLAGARKAWIAGEAAMFFSSSASQAGLDVEAKFPYAATGVPVENPETAKNGNIGGATLWAFKGHKAEEYKAIAAFFNFLNQIDNQVDWAKRTGYVPISKAAYEQLKSTGYYNEKPNREAAVIQLSRPVTEHSLGLRFGNHVQIRTIMDEELEGLFTGKKSVQAALDAITSRGNDILRQFEKQQRAAGNTTP